MNRNSNLGIPLNDGRFSPRRRSVGVHTLSEFAFCPRAGVLSSESQPDDDGEEGLAIGPKLDGYFDYDGRKFVERLSDEWSRSRLWLILLAPSLLLIYVVWRLATPFATVVAALPSLYFAARLWDSLSDIMSLVRQRAVFIAAPPAAIDMNPNQICEINWWTLRKAGFDCTRPRDAYVDEELKGRPWRLLVKDTQWRIPVIRKHRGEKTCGPQHVVRAAAYCRLVETCEGGRAPFAILLFADSYDAIIIPNTPNAQAMLDRSLREMDDVLTAFERTRLQPAPPTDQRCRGCHWGQPTSFKKETVLNGIPVPPLRIEGTGSADYHSYCGDRFQWVAPHESTIALRAANRG
jgi:hypothetical protein